MKRLLPSLLALVLLAGAPAMASKHHAMMGKHNGSEMRSRCVAGMHWVHGYMRNGKRVKGYCRK